jgi:hypothetical protein
MWKVYQLVKLTLVFKLQCKCGVVLKLALFMKSKKNRKFGPRFDERIKYYILCTFIISVLNYSL